MKTTLRLTALTLALALSASLAQSQTDGKAARFYEDALKRFERKDYSGAVVQLKNSLQIDKSQLAVHLLLGKALLATSDVANAEFELSEALRLGVNRSEVVVPLAQALIGQGKSPQVFQDNRLRLDGLPQPVLLQLLLLRSAAYTDIGDKRAALDALMAARALNPADPASWLAEVPMRVRAGQLREAALAADQALKLSPGNANAIYQKGSVLHVQGQLAAALTVYSEAIKMEAGHVDSLLARAGILIDLNRDKEASADIANLQSLTSADPRVDYLWATLAERAGDTAGAKKALKNVTEFLDPVPVEYLRYRVQTLMLNGMAHFALGEYEKAKPYLDMAYRQQPTSPLAKIIAQIAIAEPNMNRAVEVLEDYLKSRPNDGQALLMLASAQMSQGRYSKAVGLMEVALRAKDAPEFHTALGLSLMRSGQGGTALPELEKAFKADPKQAYAGMALVDLYLRDGKTAQARATADALVKTSPNNPLMLVMQAQTRMRSGDLKGARQGYEQALKMSADLQAAKMGLAHVDVLEKKYPSAETRLRAILRTEDSNVDALFEMATLEEQRGNDAQALKWLESSVNASGPRQTRANQALIAWHLRKNAPQKALEAAKLLVAKAPDDIDAMRSYARARAANGDLAGARSTLSDAVRRAGFEPSALVAIARELLDAGDLAGAAYAVDKALTAAPNLLQAQILMANIELMQGSPERSERRAQAIIQANPKLSVGHELLADVAQRRGQVGPAVESLKRAHAIDNSSRTLLNLFKAMGGQDGGKPARDLAESWLHGHPTDMVVTKALADSYARASLYPQARRLYESVLKQLPGDAEALNNLANVMLLQKDPGALGQAEKALAAQPRNPLVIDTAGWAALQAGNKDRALQLLRDARLRAPGSPDIRYHLAAALAQAGRKAEAREELQAGFALLKPGQTFASEREARELLNSLK